MFCRVIIYWKIVPGTKLFHERHFTNTLIVGTVLVIFVLVRMSFVPLAAFLPHESKNVMHIAKAGINRFRQAWNVLSFSWKNKYSLNRRAFTYCEGYASSRLDLGKEQYDGPFTTEEVEDIKNFLRLLFFC